MVSKKNWLFVLIAFILFAGLLVNYLDRVPKRHYCDFRVYYKAGQDILRGKNIYVREREDVTPFKYSPFFALVFAPLSLLPIKASAAVFFAINYILTILFFILSFRLAESSGIASSFSNKERMLIYALSGLCTFRYVLLAWDSGQVSILMCVLVLVALNFLSRNKEMGAGSFFAASVLIKYTPVVFLPYLFLQRKSKVILWTILFAGIFLLLPALVVGIQKDILYLSSWIPSIISTSLDRSSFLDPKNQSIFSMILRIFLQPQYGIPNFSLSFDQVLVYGRIAAVLLYLAVFIPAKHKTGEMAINTALLMVCVSLFNPNGWMLNFVSLVPAYMLLIQYTWSNKAKDKFVLFSLIAAVLITNIMSKDFLGKSSEDFGCAYSFTTLGALILYTALLKLKFAQD